MRMGWKDLLFLHWRTPPNSIQRHLPEGVELELWEGNAWIGIVPFEMVNVHARGLPGFPPARHFPELNVRTYVRSGGRPGLWFFSLDAASPLAVRGARWGFGLPYFDARMRLQRRAGRVFYESQRIHAGEPEAGFAAEYGPTGPVRLSEPGTLEHWFTERYCFVSRWMSGLNRMEVWHRRWPLQAAGARIHRNTMTDWLEIPLEGDPLVHYARAVEVAGFLPERA
jgi:uncharacterized protein